MFESLALPGIIVIDKKGAAVSAAASQLAKSTFGVRNLSRFVYKTVRQLNMCDIGDAAHNPFQHMLAT